LGALLPIDGRLSWVADGVEGHAPLHCYLIDTETGPVLLDSGAPVHEAALLGQLDRYLPKDEDLTLVLSRIVEFDSFGNAGTVLERYPVVHVYSQFPVLEWVYYRHVHDQTPPVANPAWTPLHGGLEIAAARDKDATVLTAIDAPVRLLATWWFYEPSTHVLFTSDSFGHVPYGSLDAPACVTADDDTTTYEDVRDHLLAKFDWVALADTQPLQEQLREIFETRPIEAVAPSYGRPIVGAELVQRHYGLMQRTFAELGAANVVAARAG
ncbi:MAG: hypothetical protein ACR2OD_08565, partial [Gaiellaceae bacterium]